jgi:hypothetical protein
MKDGRECNMSATVFLAIAILGCDFLLYALYQWTYGEKHRRLSHRSLRQIRPANAGKAKPFLVSSRKSESQPKAVRIRA